MAEVRRLFTAGDKRSIYLTKQIDRLILVMSQFEKSFLEGL